MGHRVGIDGSKVERALTARSREPFVQELKRFLEAGPTDKALKQFAAQHPDRWSQMVSAFAKLAGYTERSESLNLNLIASLDSMSDVELENKLVEMQEELAKLSRSNAHTDALIDATPSDALSNTAQEANTSNNTANES